jgi:myo-inositol catabolism protein IolS
MTDPAVPSIRLGRTNVMVPRVSLGTWAFGGENTAGTAEVGWSGHDDAQAIAALERAHRLGITHWDTADVYGNGRSEELIGEMWARGIPRDDIFLATKVGWYRGDYPHFYHPDLVKAQIEGSLRRLKTEVIDLFYLHHCNFGPDDRWLHPALRLLKDAQQAGKIRFLGLSDWDDAAIMRVITEVDPDVVQPYRNVTHDHYQTSGLAAYCHQHDVGVAFFSPLRHGLLLGKYAAPTNFPHGDFRNSDPGFRDAETIRRMADNARALRTRFSERNPEPVIGALVGSCLADCPTGTVLLGQRHPGQVDAAAHASSFTLDEDENGWVRSLYVGLES